MFGSNNKCPNCDHINKSDAKFCSNCGADLAEQRGPDIKSNAWQARSDEFAATITIQDLDGFFAKSPLVIRPGQRALVFQENQCQGVVGPGEYQLESFLSVLNRLGKHKDIWAIICREDALAVEFGLGKIPTQEFLDVEVELTVSMRVSDPDRFARMLSGKAAFTITDLRKHLQPQLRQILSEYIRGRGIRELNADENLRANLDVEISKGLESFLNDMGIGIGNIQTISVGHTCLDENNQIRAKTWLDADKKQAQLEGYRQFEVELYSEEQWAKIERLEMEYQLRAKIRDLKFNGDEQAFTDRLRRIDLLEKTLKADSREEALKIGAAEELEQLQHDAKKSGLAREDEVLSWEYEKKLVGIKRDTELSIARIEQERIVSEERVRLDRSREIADLEHEIKVARMVEGEDARRKTTALEQQLAESKTRRDQELVNKRHELELHSQDLIKREREAEAQRVNFLKDKKAEMDLAAEALNLQQRQNDVAEDAARKKEERDLSKLEKLAEIDRVYDLQKLDKEKALREEGRKDKELEARLEHEKIEALGKIGPEALIHLSSAEQGSIIADLQRSKAMQGMDSEQILAMAAENSPAVAEALKERYRNANANTISENERAMYDRMLQQQESASDRMEQMARGNQAHNAAMMEKMLNTVADIQRNSPQPQNVIVTPGGPTAVAQPVNGAVSGATANDTKKNKVLVCPSCRAENELEARFCDNCGAKLG